VQPLTAQIAAAARDLGFVVPPVHAPHIVGIRLPPPQPPPPPESDSGAELGTEAKVNFLLNTFTSRHEARSYTASPFSAT